MTDIEFEDFLAHHGILGQRWGIRNGTNYPLKDSQRSPEEKKKNPESKSSKIMQKTVQKVIDKKKESDQKKKDSFNSDQNVPKRLEKAQVVYANRSNLTDKQLEAYLKRADLERRVGELAQKEYAQEHRAEVFIKSTIAKAGSRLADKAVNYVTDGLWDSAKAFMDDHKSDSTTTAQDLKKDIKNVSTEDLKDFVAKNAAYQSANSSALQLPAPKGN